MDPGRGSIAPCRDDMREAVTKCKGNSHLDDHSFLLRVFARHSASAQVSLSRNVELLSFDSQQKRSFRCDFSATSCDE